MLTAALTGSPARPAPGPGWPARAVAVAAVWWQAFRNAEFAWLSRLNHRRIAWTPALRGYFRSHFTRVLTDRRGDALYQRNRAITAGTIAGPAPGGDAARTARATGSVRQENQRSGG